MDAQLPQTAFELLTRSQDFFLDCLEARLNYHKREFMVMEAVTEYGLAIVFFVSAVMWLDARHPIALVLCFLIFFYYVRSVSMFFCRFRESVVQVDELHHYSRRMMRSMDFHRLVVSPMSGTGGGAAYLWIGAAVLLMLLLQAAMVGFLVSVIYYQE